MVSADRQRRRPPRCHRRPAEKSSRRWRQTSAGSISSRQRTSTSEQRAVVSLRNFDLDLQCTSTANASTAAVTGTWSAKLKYWRDLTNNSARDGAYSTELTTLRDPVAVGHRAARVHPDNEPSRLRRQVATSTTSTCSRPPPRRVISGLVDEAADHLGGGPRAGAQRGPLRAHPVHLQPDEPCYRRKRAAGNPGQGILHGGGQAMNDQRRRGFTLVEMMVAIGVFAAISVGFFSVMFSVSRGSNRARAGCRRVRRGQRWDLTACSETRARAWRSPPPHGTSYTVSVDYEGDGLGPQSLTYSKSGDNILLNGEVLFSAMDCLRGFTGPCQQDVFRYTSNRLEFDWDAEGLTTWQELDDFGPFVARSCRDW